MTRPRKRGTKPAKRTPKPGPADLANRYDQLLESVADGKSVRQACDAVGVNRGDWWRAIQADDALFSRYARARELQAEALAGEIRELAESVTPQTANADRVKLDALRWIAAKLHPKVYGDFAGKGPEQVTTIGELHLHAAQRLTAESMKALPARQAKALLSSPEGQSDGGADEPR